MPNVVDQSAWWNPLLTSAILVAPTYITNDLWSKLGLTTLGA